MSKNTLTSGLINYITYSSGSLSTSGSLTVTGSLNVTNGITGSFQGVATTASYVLNAVSASYATTASYAVSASIATNAVTASHALNAVSASFATTAVTSSFANAFTVAGTLTATTLVVQTITSSVDFVTGSTRFGSLLANTHAFTGSVGMTGSLTVTGSGAFSNSGGFGGYINSNARLTITDGTSIAAYWKATNANAATRDWTIITNNANFGDFAIRQGNSQGADATSGTDKLLISAAGSATFSGSVTATSAIFNSVNSITVSAGSNIINSTYNGINGNWLTIQNAGGILYAGLEDSTSSSFGATAYAGVLYLTGARNFEIFTSSVKRFTIASTGAATLNGTTGDRLTLYNSGNNSGNNGLLINSDIYPGITFNNRVGTIGTAKIVYNTYATGYGAASLSGALLLQADNAMQFSTGGDNVRLTIASTGAATFSSSVTATSFSTSANSNISENSGTVTANTATTIFTKASGNGGGFVLVTGRTAAGDWFFDTVAFNNDNSANAISSQNGGGPPARTYAVSGNSLRLTVVTALSSFYCFGLTAKYT
jgi:hypothetical protein